MKLILSIIFAHLKGMKAKNLLARNYGYNDVQFDQIGFLQELNFPYFQNSDFCKSFYSSSLLSFVLLSSSVILRHCLPNSEVYCVVSKDSKITLIIAIVMSSKVHQPLCTAWITGEIG